MDEEMVAINEESSQHGLPPVKEAASGAFPLLAPSIYKPLGQLDRKVAAAQGGRRSLPTVVRFAADVEESLVSAGFEQNRQRRMSDPGGFVPQLSGPNTDDDSVVLPVVQAKDEGDASEWGTFVEAPRWEDWQDFAMHGAFTSPVVLDNEEEAGKRLETMSPYLPRMLAQTALYNPDIPLGESPSIQSVTGAVMIADITGFTALTERALISKRGTELIEELTVCMNNYFDEAVELVLEHGGDTIKVHQFFLSHQSTTYLLMRYNAVQH